MPGWIPWLGMSGNKGDNHSLATGHTPFRRILHLLHEVCVEGPCNRNCCTFAEMLNEPQVKGQQEVLLSRRTSCTCSLSIYEVAVIINGFRPHWHS